MDKQQEPRQYWKSLDEKYNTTEFQQLMENEFQSSPLKEDDGKDGLARRQFMKLMGASIALSTTACVRRPVQKIIPYVERPKEVVPGIANYYASSIFNGMEGLGVTVKTREGRPLHIEGSPSFPTNGTGLNPQASAHILRLYDPDRIRGPVVNSQDPKRRGYSMPVQRNWETIDKKVTEQLKKGGVHFLMKGEPAPSLNALIKKFVSNVGGTVSYWSPLNSGVLREAQDLSYGKGVVPKYRYDKAKMVVSVDADFLGTYLNSVESSKLYSSGRNPDSDNFSRMVSFQSVPSLTSFNSDDNYPIKPSQQIAIVMNMIHELLFVQNHSKFAGDSSIKAKTEPFSKTYLGLGLSHPDFAKIVKGLWDNKGQSLVVAGGLQTKTKDALGLQVAVNLLNSALENDGKTVDHGQALKGHYGKDQDLTNLLAKITAGEVKTLVIDDVNFAYDVAIDEDFKKALSQVEMVISTSNWMDETASIADVVAPKGHPMENWGDYEFQSGLFAIQQPTISPLWETRSLGDSLMAWSKSIGKSIASEETFFEYLKNRWKKKLGSEQAWFDFLQSGKSGSASGSGSARNFNKSSLSVIKGSEENSNLELALYPTMAIGDGSTANVSWLQELPDPVTKVVWDNYLTVSPKMAKEKKLKTGDVVELKSDDVVVKVPVLVNPGQHPEVVGMPIGYGRKQGGDILKGIGVDASPLIDTSEDGRLIYAGLPVEIKKTGDCYDLVSTQGHHSMEGRQIVAETSLKSFKETNDIGIHRHHIFSLWGKHSYDGHRWALGIDLNSCTGCSACMVSCQSENNIPVVGKKYIMQGREMHWIRIDRYYSGDEYDNPDALMQPVMCQHCENAPCESVCPVVATVHSDEGLNDMVYNRCVGTRYCSNNCPYKVRRFNWFYYDSHHKKAPLEMALNPDVTVRTRGVMEKCSFCVQRIHAGKNTAKDEGRALEDGDIKTACQSVCPTDAIVFGDLADPNSRVSKWFNSSRQYTLLEEANAAPRVRYLAKIRNTEREVGFGHHGHGGGHGDDHGAGHEVDHKDGHGETHGEEHSEVEHKEGH